MTTIRRGYSFLRAAALLFGTSFLGGCFISDVQVVEEGQRLAFLGEHTWKAKCSENFLGEKKESTWGLKESQQKDGSYSYVVFNHLFSASPPALYIFKIVTRANNLYLVQIHDSKDKTYYHAYLKFDNAANLKIYYTVTDEMNDMKSLGSKYDIGLKSNFAPMTEISGTSSNMRKFLLTYPKFKLKPFMSCSLERV